MLWINDRIDNNQEVIMGRKGFDWSDDAIERLERVPAGFMRDMTKKRIEGYAKEIGVNEISLDVADSGISAAREAMSSMMGGQSPMGGQPPVVAEQEAAVNNPDKTADSGDSDNVAYYFCDICGYTVKAYPPDECPICRADTSKFRLVENKDEHVTSSSGRALEWTPDATERIANTPEGFMRDMTKWRIEALARKKGSATVTVALIEEKYKLWGNESVKITETLSWSDDAKEKIGRIPSVVRGMVIKEVENEAERCGANTVTPDLLTRVRNKWSSSGEFHSDLAS